VGLGGNISQSLARFFDKGEPYTKAGDALTSGNGSLMRLAPVAVFYHRDIKEAGDMAARSSYVTHQGDEAAECCRLLATIISTAIKNEKPGDKSFLGNLSEIFKSTVPSVNTLARGEQEGDDPNRNWKWKTEEGQVYKYAPERAMQQPGYIGSYSMDALAMALHCVWTCDNFVDTLIKTVNLRGDSDSVGSVAGQIAGAIYGCSQIPTPWISTIEKWDGGGTIALRAYKLYHFREPTNSQSGSTSSPSASTHSPLMDSSTNGGTTVSPSQEKESQEKEKVQEKDTEMDTS